MAIYRIRKCPYCKHQIGDTDITGISDFSGDIGEPEEVCLYCFRTFKTGRDFWETMSPAKKTKVYIKLGFSLIFVSLFFASLLLALIALLQNIFKFDISNELLFSPTGIILLIIIGAILATYLILKKFNKLVEKFRTPPQT